MLPLLLLLSCGPKAPPPVPPTPEEVAWLSLSDTGPRLCLSPVHQGERLGRGERADLERARELLVAGKGQEIQVALLPDHPAAQVIRGALLVQGAGLESAREIFRDLGNTWTEDPCVQQAAGLVSLMAGRLVYAQPYIDAAREGWPDQPDVALLAGVFEATASGDLDGAMALVRPAAQAHPEHLPSQAWLGRALVLRGRMDEALPMLQRAHAGGVDVTSELAVASRYTGDLATYLSLVGISPPLPVDLRGAADPVAAYRDALGITEGQPLVARIQTSLGAVECELHWQQAPLTVGNFVALARGLVPWTDPATGQPRTGPLYEGLVFHRVIQGFMAQTGDPTGTGSGGPGWAFIDETTPALRFDRPGVLAMANSGPHTNGSQWFVTDAPTPHLDGRHTIFGTCTEDSLAVVRAITAQPTDRQDRPVSPITLERVELR